MSKRVRWYSVVVGIATVAILVAEARPCKSVFKPKDYASLGVLDLKSGDTVEFDTGGATNIYTPRCRLDTGGGWGSWIDGTTAVSQSGGVQVAVFAFSSINIPAGVTVSVLRASTPAGDTQWKRRALVLASHSSLTLGSTLNATGGNGTYSAGGSAGGAGGPGAEGGTPGPLVMGLATQQTSNPSLGSAPPDYRAGSGGDNVDNWIPWPGDGYGGGLATHSQAFIWGGNQTHGAGGGYAGRGGNARVDNGRIVDCGGYPYGDALLTELYGGSGGTAGGHQYGQSSGGGGGGAVELTAMGTLQIRGAVTAGGGSTEDNGYRGGGGSGGAILLAAPFVDIAAATLSVVGGWGGSGDSGGGGSGGRIAIYANRINLTGATISTNGGTGGGGARNGAPGTYRYNGDGGAGDLKFPFQSGTIVMFR
jgi:hypothetical protein